MAIPGFLHLTFFDALLVVIVTAQTTALSYLYNPKWKAFVYGIPFPFTLAALAVGQPVGASNVLGLIGLMMYSQCVRILYKKFNVPIVAAIVISLMLYGALGMLLAPIIPHTAAAFWPSCALVVLIGVAILGVMPPREEQGHRTPLSPAVKIVLTLFVVVGLVFLKSRLQGFTTMFPMVGVLGAYESRHSLWTMNRQVSVIMMTVTPMVVTVWLLQDTWGLPLSLATSWIVFGLAMCTWLKFGRRLDKAWHAVETV